MPHPENNTEKTLTDKSDHHPLPMNWPPSRGPEPEWITREPKRDYPTPKIAECPGAYEYRHDKLVWYSVWTQVVDLLKAGPDLSERLVVAAKVEMYHAEDGAAGVPKAQTLKYLELAHPGIDGRTLKATLSYPLKSVVAVAIEPFTIDFHWRPEGDPKRLRKDMTIGWVLWSIARAYELIYADHEKYGVWGHSIRDLCFEAIAFKDDRVFVMVGS